MCDIIVDVVVVSEDLAYLGGIEDPFEIGVVGEGFLDYFDCAGDVGFCEGDYFDGHVFCSVYFGIGIELGYIKVSFWVVGYLVG